MLLILALGTTYITTYQNVSAVGDGSVSNTIEVNSNTTNGPILNNEDNFGRSITNIGDLNNDGVNDIVVGAIYDNGDDGLRYGAVHIMFMNTDGSVSKTVEINSNTTNGPALSNNDYFGYSVANIGDLNGDGISDIVAGANGDDAGGFNRGAIHIMFMNTDGSVSQTVEINSNTTNGPALSNYDYFGYSVANIGDLNGDGISDIVVGADGDDAGGFNRGAIHIMFMNTDGSVSQTVKINGNTPNGPTLNDLDYFGRSIAYIGDLNGDGISDIVAGADGDDAGGFNRGAIHIMFMNTDGSVSQTVKINGNTPNGPTLNNQDYFGRSIAYIGDLNGDGTSDIAVGADGDDAGGFNRGAIHIMFMNTDGSVSQTVEINGNTTNGPTLNNQDYFGRSIAYIGDLNGDGTSDIAVGATGDDAGGDSRGTVHILTMNNTDLVPPTIIPVNLLNDPYSLSSWTIHINGGDGWLDFSSGKKNWVPSEQAFATSYKWAEKSQLVPIPSTYGKLVLTEDYSKTYCGEKKGSFKNNPPYDRYYLALLLLDSSGNEIERHVTGQIEMKDSCNWSRNWHTAEIVVDSIPEDTVSVLVKHGGISGERWAGWYGPVMKDIKLVYQ